MNNHHNGLGMKSALLIVVLLAAAVGLTGILYSRNSSRVQQVSLQESMVESLTVHTQATLPPEPSQAPTVSALPAITDQAPEEEAVQAVQIPEPKPLTTTSPVSGQTIGAYAMEALSYNETTRDWRVHNGIDLAAEEGTPVVAAAEGIVYTTYEDDTMGYTVVIRHEGGYTTRYSSLRDDLCVQAGDHVAMGQTIGYAGDTALVETVMGSHVHFSVSCQDIPMDPQDFLALG